MNLRKANPSKSLNILKELIVQARQEKGLTQEELAKAVCLSKWQIKEMEESDSFLIFYTMQIKVHAAKRIGRYLGLKEAEYLQDADKSSFKLL
ncbi:helix-turn-helix domain-containing protein [Polynucleobacter nymphae]|uniref:helix-turn-helix domain-containing protein n=1 Tax=Polynucleobacter nymphae TaxID=2081043 RepID=UPI001C0AF215|nr:helix-turn-helix domain-containing protein [Polynucleobacter nymphae]MBU3608545.1 helix-turn-helix domain-containing protein [Polynucleobacter nymphae]